MTHARKVDTGICGSSVLATADRTSGYGESSSAAERQTIVKTTYVLRTKFGGIRVEIRILKLGERSGGAEIWYISAVHEICADRQTTTEETHPAFRPRRSQR